MINRIKFIEKPKSKIEILLENIDPKWKEGDLFHWNYMFDYPQQLTPDKVYTLGDFEKKTDGTTIIYYKKTKFILELIRGNYVRVLTNIEPPRKEENYFQKEKIKIPFEDFIE